MARIEVGDTVDYRDVVTGVDYHGEAVTLKKLGLCRIHVDNVRFVSRPAPLKTPEQIIADKDAEIARLNDQIAALESARPTIADGWLVYDKAKTYTFTSFDAKDMYGVIWTGSNIENLKKLGGITHIRARR